MKTTILSCFLIIALPIIARSSEYILINPEDQSEGGLLKQLEEGAWQISDEDGEVIYYPYSVSFSSDSSYVFITYTEGEEPARLILEPCENQSQYQY